jgi:hypothetical protein
MCPVSELVIDQAVHLVEYPFGDARPVVVGPTSDDGIERCDDSDLGRSTSPSNLIPYLVEMPLDALATWLDDCLEAGFASIRGDAMFSDVILLDVKAEKVKPYIPFVLIQSVGNASLAGLEVQPDLR